MSPRLNVATMQARVLVAQASRDGSSPAAGVAAFVSDYNATHLLQPAAGLILDAGPLAFVHAKVSQAAMATYVGARTAMLVLVLADHALGSVLQP